MRSISLGATRAALPDRFVRRNGVDDLAANLVRAGYIHDHHYLEMKHLDPKWMVASFVYAIALYRALGGNPYPASTVHNPDRD